jgi:hypothetical protein
MNPAAVSPAGAIGLFQLMPGTAAGLNVDPNDVQQNIAGGVAYLSQLSAQFGGDPSLTLAAYNAGPGAVAQYGGVPPYSETQTYIARVLNFWNGSTPADSQSLDAGVGDAAAGVDPAAVPSVTVLAAVGVAAAALVWLLLR